MRNAIQIVGLGNRMTGTSSKTGRAYDFQSISFTYPDKFTTGVKAATASVNGPDIDALPGGLMIGREYDAVYHTSGNAIYIDAILGEVGKWDYPRDADGNLI